MKFCDSQRDADQHPEDGAQHDAGDRQPEGVDEPLLERVADGLRRTEVAPGNREASRLVEVGVPGGEVELLGPDLEVVPQPDDGEDDEAQNDELERPREGADVTPRRRPVAVA